MQFNYFSVVHFKVNLGNEWTLLPVQNKFIFVYLCIAVKMYCISPCMRDSFLPLKITLNISACFIYWCGLHMGSNGEDEVPKY
jgi:hypothetical protein